MEEGFQKAQTDNLPQISEVMILNFFAANTDLFSSVEIKGLKAERSARNSYSDNAVGYVQVKRDGSLCTVKARITPEHKIRKKAYSVTLVCDEIEEGVLSLQCDGCAASKGGCKHTIAFIFWLHRKCSVPSPTEVECYWKKSKLAHVGTNKKFIHVSELGERNVQLPPKDPSILEECMQLVNKNGIKDLQLCNYFSGIPNAKKISIHHMLIKKFSRSNGTSAGEFLDFIKNEMTPNLCVESAAQTLGQNKSSLWHELRYGRVTASRIYDASRCSFLNGSLVEAILGAKFRPTEAIKRGTRLETRVIEKLKHKYNIKIKPSGLLLNPIHPVFGASPDGVTTDFIVEIKCPLSEKTMNNYLVNNVPAEKYHAQMQIQMLFANKQKGLFCLAHPDFENSSRLTEIWVDYNDAYCKDVMIKALLFWEEAIFPAIYKIVKN